MTIFITDFIYGKFFYFFDRHCGIIGFCTSELVHISLIAPIPRWVCYYCLKQTLCFERCGKFLDFFGIFLTFFFLFFGFYFSFYFNSGFTAFSHSLNNFGLLDRFFLGSGWIKYCNGFMRYLSWSLSSVRTNSTVRFAQLMVSYHFFSL